MVSKILRNIHFQALLAKVLVILIVYVQGISILKFFAFAKNFSDTAIIALDMAIVSYIVDQILISMLRRYINIYVSIKNKKTAENITIFERGSNSIQKVILTVSIKSKSKFILNLIKSILKNDKLILKLKWAHDTWLTFQRVNGLLTMNPDALFYAETDGLCINLFDPVQLDEVEAEIIDTPLLISCDMGDKTEGEIVSEINLISNSRIKKKLLNLIVSLWLDVFYVPHKIKVV
ncbi:MAG: hypothetical protein JG776_1077 [Caloramator sp.]|uniref:hypothetical protein n=1 Tax=Caloramator sp. TaxID=1871330 RepID=UPI001D3E0C25|nr:hypothetical protein [Caloramator sp.]MBZ4663375.1 hypothetical protein [Caloramator sp.]